ncbi:hypothetical protein GQF01_18785 [Paenibacillus sp. 5J-6]|uniref:Uncharacterized protein n=1 Tax=Paenibacillus silvestris TaxID=2606219 RepID=A0A6L8V3N1_9BACL|nr:hypothetical protein [Paenibacillus silvestris]MZQ84166.1 hypothetical protein [Paenibacillus silvestris]
MQRRKAIRGKLEKMLWFCPVLILAIGSLPNVTGSMWWDAFGVVLFVSIIIICGTGFIKDEEN